jgi:hypothetical protein
MPVTLNAVSESITALCFSVISLSKISETLGNLVGSSFSSLSAIFSTSAAVCGFKPTELPVCERLVEA